MKHGVSDPVPAARSERDFEERYGPMLDAVRKSMSACEISGEIRPGADAGTA
jgi:hypothetical protein